MSTGVAPEVNLGITEVTKNTILYHIVVRWVRVRPPEEGLQIHRAYGSIARPVAYGSVDLKAFFGGSHSDPPSSMW